MKKLQEFLNEQLGLNIVVDGIFDFRTLAAVEIFQRKYWQEVLLPWVPYGFPDAHKASGWVYKTTLTHINRIMCPGFEIPSPILP